MTPELTCKQATVETLLQEVRQYKNAGYRLVQIGATRVADELQLTYSFDKVTRLEHLRLCLPSPAGTASPALPSISSIYWCAFLYENELHDLFDVQVTGLAVDFHGNLYKTAVKFPFGSTKPPRAPQGALSPPRSPVGQTAEGKGPSRPPCRPSPANGSPVRQPPANPD